MSKKNETVKTAVSEKIKEKKSSKFDLEAFKKTKNLSETAKFKEQEWIPVSEALGDIISLPGIPHGHITIIRGHSDTGKTLAMIEIANSVQQMGKLPVFIITEMKWQWDRAIKMGLKVAVKEEKDGTLTYSGDFIYVDRSSLNTIEDVAAFISDLLSEQLKGNLPYELVFMWDSAGSIPSSQSVESGKNNAMWNAGAMATQFGNFINQQFPLSRKIDHDYTNSFIVVNKVRVEYPIGNPMEKPKLKNKGGDAMYWDATLVITFGNITNSGVSKIEAVKNGKKVTFAKRTKVSVDKNHITNATTSGRIIMTEYGFIKDDKKSLDLYKKEHSKEWLNVLGSGDFDIIEEDEVKENEKADINNLLDNITDE